MSQPMSSSVGDEHFEFVDYTSVSSMERLVTAIEEVLLSWGVKDQAFWDVNNSASTFSSSADHVRQETICVGEDTYRLLYYQQAVVHDDGAGDHPYAFGDFYLHDLIEGHAQQHTHQQQQQQHQQQQQQTQNGAGKAVHPLHRWTGLSKFFLLVSVSESLKSKLFSSSRAHVSPAQASTLISACALAFNAVHCVIPVFVPVGQARTGAYYGFLLDQQRADDLQVHWRVSVLPAPQTHVHMHGLADIFKQKVDTIRFDNGLSPLSSREKEGIVQGAVFTYHLKNSYKDDWKQWDEMADAEARRMMNDESEADSYDATTPTRDTLRDDAMRSISDWKPDYLPELPFGSFNDPLRSMTLSAVFPVGKGDATLVDDAVHSNMDALTAGFWRVRREFAPASQQRAFLSSLVDHAVYTWIRDPGNADYLAPFDSDNRADEQALTILSSSSPGTSSHASPAAQQGDAGLVRQLFYHAMGQPRRLPSGQATSSASAAHAAANTIKPEQIEEMLYLLFHGSHDNGGDNDTDKKGGMGAYDPFMASSDTHIFPKTNKTNSDEKDNVVLFTPSALGLRFKHGTTVPQYSFLWNMLVLCLQAAHDANKGSRLASPVSIITLLRLLWIDILRRIRWHWDHLIPLPAVNPYLYHHDQDKSVDKQPLLGIDLRYNLVHQKLNMLNCCIHQRRILKENVPVTVVAVDDDASQDQMKQSSAFDKLNDFLEQLIDGDQVPEIEDDQDDDDTTPSPKGANSDPSDMSDSEFFFDSVEDMDKTVVLDRVTTSENAEINHEEVESSKRVDESCSSSMSDVSVLGHAMQESFVRLNYSPSTEFDARTGQINENGAAEDHGNDDNDDDGDDDNDDDDAGLLDWTETNPDAELTDPDAYDGRLEQHPSLCLLSTGVPLWTPVTQNPGFMTEDMVQQQADVFEKMGNSVSATQLRARLQSAHLYSDMQAFKAANPTAILEDFVRWHSPKDWIDDEQEQEQGRGGHLSARMADPNNIWQDLWKRARRVPASRQKSLFDLKTEGEKALHYLESISVNELFSMMLPTVGLIVYDTLVSHPIVKRIRSVANGMQQLSQELIHYPWDALRNGQCVFDGVITMIKREELVLCNAISLLRKLPGQYDLVDRLLNQPQTKVQEGDERATVFQLFRNDEYGTIGKPSSKEFVFYLDAGADCLLPQRLYVLEKDNETRFCDMYSLDGRYC
ncbi:Rab3 GTPase-activating protein catalytic subunit-domain-containing protein [Gongronella butleri]|nr:Rab3 GTPase-activating protein catalytic subunit-domain-containing protein [Gongronella butleri]